MAIDTIDAKTFRAVMSRFATGVTVVTTCNGPRRFGITVNAFCSVSLDPPLVLICIERTSRVRDILRATGVFAVNFLSEGQQELSVCFASNSDERYGDFCHAASHVEATGAPVLDGTLGFVDCRVVNVFPGGDHDIFIGQVEALGTSDAPGTSPDRPLLYYHSRYHRLSEDPQ